MNSELILTLILGALSGGLLGFFGQALSAYTNRDKIKADARKTIAESNEINIKNQSSLQKQIEDLVKQIDNLIERNLKLEEDRDKKRDANRKEFDRIYDEVRTLKNELLTVQTANSGLINKVNILQNMNFEKDAKIKELELLVAEHAETIIRYGTELGALKRATGKLLTR